MFCGDTPHTNAINKQFPGSGVLPTRETFCRELLENTRIAVTHMAKVALMYASEDPTIVTLSRMILTGTAQTTET